MEKFGCFKYRIYSDDMKKWHYQIFKDDGTPLRDSQEVYLFEGIARFAVIGHISLLEQKKG